jgi:peptide/nickel transport system substrate-binding protein
MTSMTPAGDETGRPGRRRARLATAAVGTLAVVSLVACAPAAPDTADRSIVIAVAGISSNFDPVNGAWLYGSFDTQAVYDSLIVWDQDTGAFDPCLATDWQIAPDRKSMTMDLRDDVDFVDGTHLDAEGVASFLTAALANPTYAQGRLSGIHGLTVEAVDEYRLEFTVAKTPIDLYFLILVAMTPIPSAAAISDPESLATTAVGSGPYVVEETVPEVSVTLVRNEDYWDLDAFPFERIELKVFVDNVAALNALKTGQVDAAGLDIPLAVEAAASGFVLTSGSKFSRLLYIQDRAGAINPAFADVRVRQAMNLAFDRQAILDNIDLGYGYVSSQVYTKGQPGYLEGRDDEYPYDPERARELLAEAGYPEGFDLTIPTTGYLAPFDPVVQQYLGDIGIRVTFETLEIGDYVTRASGGEFPVIMWAEMFPTINEGFFGADSFWNGSHFTTPEVEDLVFEVGSADPEEATAAAQKLAEYMLEEAWLVPFARPATIWASTDEVDVRVEKFVYSDQLRWFQLAE